MLGMITKPMRLVLSVALVIVFLWVASKVGIPMYNQWRETGKVSVPSVSDLKLDELKDRASEYIPELDRLPNIGSGNPSGNNGSPAGSTDSGADALATLNTLPVKGKAPKTGYSREQFGSAWSDKASGVLYAGNGCDTRNDILARDLVNITKDGKCKVLSGTLQKDPYTGNTINWKRGPESARIQIEHIVALGNAWVTGAQRLTPEQRLALANDPRNLIAVDGPTNGAKGDRDASGWLPPYKPSRCSYIAAQVNVKKIYHLWVTPAEKEAMTNILRNCG